MEAVTRAGGTTVPGDLSRFLAAAARWLGASMVRVVQVGEAPSDPVGSAALAWLGAGAVADDASTVIGPDRVEFVEIRGKDGSVLGAMSVQRAVRRPRPATQSDRIEAVAALVERLLALPAETPVDDLEAAGRATLTDAVRAAGHAAVFVVGVDRLAVVNEVFGRPGGDAVLDAINRRLGEWAGPEAVTARLSGTRLGAVRPDLTDLNDATRAAYELRDILAAPVSIGPLPVSRSASVGVLVGTGADADNVVNYAMRGSLAARESGGDAVRSYDPALADERLGRLQLELELDNALRTGQLRLFYQPEFDLRTGQLLAVEALLRWDHPRLGLVRADAFVDDTERTRTFADVQRWVVEEACRQLAVWQALPGARALGVRINVSAWQIARGEIAAQLLATIERHGLPPDSVCVELTERRMPRRPARIVESLRQLSARGISIAIDDFGTGQGTVSQLTTLPVDTIKIDQSFVSAMRGDPRADAVVAGIIALAGSLSLETVAEGVDAADTAARLVQLGCTRGQGNSLGEAMPGDEVVRFLDR